MNPLAKYLLSAVVFAAAIPVSAQSVRDISEQTLNSAALIMPESAETDTKAMLEDWYLKNYAVIDYDADNADSGDLSDEVIIERLGKLPTVIEMPFNSVVKNTIRYYANRKQLVENMLGLSLYYNPIFVEALERNGMPLELKYLPVIESALVPTAVSRAGAAGLWQFMTATASGLGLEVNSIIDQRRDPYLASDAAAKYLKQLYETFGDWSLAIAAYNCGPGNVNKALRRAGEGKHDFWEIYPFLPKETRGYVPAFIAANYIMTYHKEHNISPALARRPIVTDTVHVNRRVHFQQISDVLAIPMNELRALNPQFRKDIIPGDIKPYSLVLPSLQVYAYIANEDSILNHNASSYARRGVVEPSSGAVTGSDSKGEYYEEEVVKYHKVRKGETLSKIAKKYGVTVASIRQHNKVRKSVRAGKRLKIVTVQRRYRPKTVPVPENDPEENAEDTTEATPGTRTDDDTVSHETPAETDSVAAEPKDEVSGAFDAPKETPAPKPEAKQDSVKKDTAKKTAVKKETPKKETKTSAKKTEKKPSVTMHKIRRGESLSKIAKKYGVTVEAIKRANNFSNDRITAGETIKIPTR